MDGAISILSFAKGQSTAALVGRFSGEDTEFLAQHLDELSGDVILECEHLEELGAAGASTLLEFRRSRGSQGRHVIFRGIPDHCRAVMLEQAVREQHCVRSAASTRGFSTAPGGEPLSDQPTRGGDVMGEQLDEAKGRVKEAAGDLTDDEDLKREGKLDRAGASVKEKVGDVADKIGNVVDDAKDKLRSKGDKS